jgi:hypothetical protein
MRRMGIITLSSLALLSGCSILGYDHSAKVAIGILNRHGGQMDAAVYTAALNARFPAGTPTAALMDFVHDLGGQCKEHGAGPTQCDVPLSGTFCVASDLVITAAMTPTGAIDHIAAGRLEKAC